MPTGTTIRGKCQYTRDRGQTVAERFNDYIVVLHRPDHVAGAVFSHSLIVSTCSLKTVAKSNEIASKTVVVGSPITSARPIGINTTITTAASNENSIRLESKLDSVLIQIVTLSSQFDQKITALRQEVTDRYKKITDKLTADAENREKYLEAKVNIVASNVAVQQEQFELQQQQYISVKQQLDQLNEYIDIIKPIDLGFINIQVPLPIKTNNDLVKQYTVICEGLTNTNKLVAKNLQRIQLRTRTYDGNFRLIYNKLKEYKHLEELETVYGEIDTVSTGQS